jgi:hypothetical protein
LIIAAEKNFENRLKKFLEDEGCWFVKFFANAYTKSGVPDLLVCCNGYFIGVEVKAPKGKPSELQKWNIDKINEANGIGVVLYPDQFTDFKELILCLNDGMEMRAWRIAREINERWLK